VALADRKELDAYYTTEIAHQLTDLAPITPRCFCKVTPSVRAEKVPVAGGYRSPCAPAPADGVIVCHRTLAVLSCATGLKNPLPSL
jgi:hypothetical protein